MFITHRVDTKVYYFCNVFLMAGQPHRINLTRMRVPVQKIIFVNYRDSRRNQRADSHSCTSSTYSSIQQQWLPIVENSPQNDIITRIKFGKASYNSLILPRIIRSSYNKGQRTKLATVFTTDAASSSILYTSAVLRQTCNFFKSYTVRTCHA